MWLEKAIFFFTTLLLLLLNNKFSLRGALFCWVGLGLLLVLRPQQQTRPQWKTTTKRRKWFDPLFALQPSGAERIPRWNSSLGHFQKTMFIFSVTVSSGLMRNFPILFRFAHRDKHAPPRATTKIFTTFKGERDSSEDRRKKLDSATCDVAQERSQLIVRPYRVENLSDYCTTLTVRRSREFVLIIA